MECRVRPYEGTEAKAAVIHAGEDDASVFPFIERLHRCGLRVWHDSEIRKVMVDYSRSWKKQQADCAAYIVFLTENAVNSHVFRERFSGAVESGKPLVLVTAVDRNALSPGMRLQADKASKAVKTGPVPAENLAREIAQSDVLQKCLGSPDPDMEVSSYPGENQTRTKPAPVKAERSVGPSERTVLELRGSPDAAAPVPAAVPENAPGKPAAEDGPEPVTAKADSGADPEKTIRLDTGGSAAFEDPDATLVPRKLELPVILSMSSGEKKRGLLGEASVGRVRKIQGSAADISFTDGCKLFSGRHFLLVYIDQICMLICRHPNGMNVNGQEMREGDKYTVDSEAVVRIPSDATLSRLEREEALPACLVVASGERAGEIWRAGAIALLRSEETGETRILTDRFLFGRGNAWKTGVMVSRNISRNHGEILLDSNCYIYRDHSTNGTMINGNRISNEDAELKDGDVISVQGDDQKEETFLFRCRFFTKG